MTGVGGAGGPRQHSSKEAAGPKLGGQGAQADSGDSSQFPGVWGEERKSGKR